MWESRVRLQRAVLHDLDGARSRRGIRDDLVGLAIHYEDRNTDFFQVVGVILLDERGDTVILALCAPIMP